MIYSNLIMNAVLATMAGKKTFEDIAIIKEFPRERRDNPLGGVVISLGAESISVKKLSDKNGIEAAASPMTVKVKLTVCVPKSYGGNHCYDVLDRIIEALGELITTYNVASIESGELKYSSTLRALVLPVTVTIDAGNVYEA
ncbi:MAG: hypothetical protein E7525_07255 [Ruminococcaceae bacterium]|nr:hypothetical protein [Oscillospiraceae bacterium]